MSTFQDREIQTYWFSSAKIWDFSGGATYSRMLWASLEKSRNIGFRLSEISTCLKVDVEHIHEYFLRVGKKEYRLFSDKRIKAFEEQFPFFPYDQSKNFVFALDKIAELEKQNLMLLSHVEAIMTCLRMRGITDDNLDFSLPDN